MNLDLKSYTPKIFKKFHRDQNHGVIFEGRAFLSQQKTISRHFLLIGGTFLMVKGFSKVEAGLFEDFEPLYLVRRLRF